MTITRHPILSRADHGRHLPPSHRTHASDLPPSNHAHARHLPPYWAVARLEPRREQLALHFLAANGYTTYCPRLREQRRSHGRKIEVRPLLFPGYAFISIQLQWHAARWTVGVLGLIMDGSGPARVSDDVIAEIRSRERGGLIELPRRELVRGDRVRVMQGPLRGLTGLVAGMRAHERVAILLGALGQLIVRRDDVEPIAPENHQWPSKKT
jgi:transcription antitermination factor NusG